MIFFSEHACKIKVKTEFTCSFTYKKLKIENNFKFLKKPKKDFFEGDLGQGLWLIFWTEI